MSAWYVPKHVTQQDGSKCAGSNCWAAVGAWLYAGATGGTAKLTPTDFRQMAGGGSGSRDESGCRSGFEGDIVKGLDRLGVKAGSLELEAVDARVLLSEDRRALFAVATDYELWPESADCLRGTFTGNHMVGLIAGPTLKVMNPLCGDYQVVNVLRVLAAAEKFARDHGRNRILIVRAPRPLPQGLAEDKATIARLEGVIEDQQEAMASARSMCLQAASLLAPKAPTTA